MWWGMTETSLTQLLPTGAGFVFNFSRELFRWDPWSQLFIALICGIGFLVAIHAWGYFKSKTSKAKFFAVFLPFALSMAGVVTLDHLLLLFIAWELTSILSFYLVTFNGESPDARRGGQHALLITGMGGLSLLGGILLLGATENAWTLTAALNVDLALNPLGGWIAGLIVLGALTKSAQFPFHFWLSGAMTAPTPASAYLHSATMVKAGIYLFYRLWPFLSAAENVTWIVFTIGIITFAWGAFLSLMQLDLKGVLAGTTIAHLGLMTAMIAWPDHDLSVALFALVLSHATYKAGLFMFSGVIEKLSDTRRIDLMSGLRFQSPFIFGIGLILAGASLGLPGTLAYYAKSLMDLPLMWKLALTLGFLILGKAGLLVAVRPFMGPPPAVAKSSSGLTLMWIPPLFLGLISWLAIPLGGVGENHWEAKNLALSIGAAIIAVALLRRWSPEWQKALNNGPWIQGANFFDQIWYGHLDFAKFIRGLIQPSSLALYVLTVMATFTCGVLWIASAKTSMSLIPWPRSIPLDDVFVWLCLGQIVATLFVLRTTVPIRSILFLGLVGYLFAVILALAGAPDLAMTQFSVETLSVLVLLYAAKGVGPIERRPLPIRTVGILVSSLVGVALTLATAIASLSTQESRLRQYFAETSWLEAHGRNVVNVILVDYRALDTMGEITVLGVAALGVFLLLSPKSKGRSS